MNFEQLLTIEDFLVRDSLEVRKIVENSSLSLKEIANFLNISKLKLKKIIENGAYDLTVEKYLQLLYICGYKVSIKKEKI